MTDPVAAADPGRDSSGAAPLTTDEGVEITAEMLFGDATAPAADDRDASRRVGGAPEPDMPLFTAPVVPDPAAILPKDPSTFTPEQIESLGWPEVRLMSQADLIALSKRIDALLLDPTTTAEQKAQIDAFQKDDGGKVSYEYQITLAAGRYQAAAAEGKLAIPPQKIASWSEKQVRESVGALHLGLIKPEDIDQLKVHALPPDVFATLSIDQLQGLSQEQIERLTPTQLAALRPEQRQAFTAEQLEHFSDEVMTSSVELRVRRRETRAGVASEAEREATIESRIQALRDAARDRYMGTPEFNLERIQQSIAQIQNPDERQVAERAYLAVVRGDRRNQDEFPGLERLHPMWARANTAIEKAAEQLERVKQMPEDRQEAALATFELRFNALLNQRDVIQRDFLHATRMLVGEAPVPVAVGREVYEVSLQGKSHVRFSNVGAAWQLPNHQAGDLPQLPRTPAPDPDVPPPPPTPDKGASTDPVRGRGSDTEIAVAFTSVDEARSELAPYLDATVRRAPGRASAAARDLQDSYETARDRYLGAVELYDKFADLIGEHAAVGSSQSQLDQLSAALLEEAEALRVALTQVQQPNSGLRLVVNGGRDSIRTDASSEAISLNA